VDGQVTHLRDLYFRERWWWLIVIIPLLFYVAAARRAPNQIEKTGVEIETLEVENETR